MENQELRQLANAIAMTIAEVEYAPEGVLYAGVMKKVDLDQFKQILSVLDSAGLIERQDGFVVVATPKLKGIIAKFQVSVN